VVISRLPWAIAAGDNAGAQDLHLASELGDLSAQRLAQQALVPTGLSANGFRDHLDGARKLHSCHILRPGRDARLLLRPVLHIGEVSPDHFARHPAAV
jgi:hypothetical protein